MGKIKTGVPGLDQIFKGGLEEHTSLLVTGVPGVGKTIMGLQYIYEGLKKGEAGMIISCEIDEANLIQYANSIGIDLAKYQKLLTILYVPLTGKIITLGTMAQSILKKKIKRVVLDSITLFKYLEKSELEFRQELSNFINSMKQYNVTLIATSERELGYLDNITYKTEDFLFDGLVFVTKIRKGSDYERCLSVVKIRGQEHLTGIYPLTIKKGGVTVFPEQIPFSLIEKDD